MAYCANCGQKLADGSKYCVECGSFVGTTNKNTAGIVIKCPSCGEDIPSFTAICPACGHEINSAKVSATLKEFIENINECDRLIANTPNSKKAGWSSWGKGKRFWWIVFNIFTYGIPLVIYLIMPLVRLNYTPRLTPEEKRKASLIENFPFPNEREAILEALLFTKSKISYLAAEKVDRKNAYWTRLWSTKGEQLYQRAEMMFSGDEIANNAYKDIKAQKLRVSKTVKFKAISGIVILVAALVFISIKNGAFDSIIYSNTPLIIPDTELSKLIPQIENGKGIINTNNSTYFSIEYYGISDTRFDEYKTMCKNSGFTIDCESDGSLFDAYNEDGYNMRITYYDNKMHITVTDKMDMNKFIWPDSEIASLLPIPKSDYGNLYSASDTCMIIYI